MYLFCNNIPLFMNHLHLIAYCVGYMKIPLYDMFFLLCALTGNISSNILSSLRDVILGVLLGIVLGMFARHFPGSDQVNKKQSLFGSTVLDISRKNLNF